VLDLLQEPLITVSYSEQVLTAFFSNSLGEAAGKKLYAALAARYGPGDKISHQLDRMCRVFGYALPGMNGRNSSILLKAWKEYRALRQLKLWAYN